MCEAPAQTHQLVRQTAIVTLAAAALTAIEHAAVFAPIGAPGSAPWRAPRFAPAAQPMPRVIRMRARACATPDPGCSMRCSLAPSADRLPQRRSASAQSRAAVLRTETRTHSQPPQEKEKYRCRDSLRQAMSNAVNKAVVPCAGDSNTLEANRIYLVANSGFDVDIRAKMGAADRQPGPPRIVTILVGGVAGQACHCCARSILLAPCVLKSLSCGLLSFRVGVNLKSPLLNQSYRLRYVSLKKKEVHGQTCGLANPANIADIHQLLARLCHCWQARAGGGPGQQMNSLPAPAPAPAAAPKPAPVQQLAQYPAQPQQQMQYRAVPRYAPMQGAPMQMAYAQPQQQQYAPTQMTYQMPNQQAYTGYYQASAQPATYPAQQADTQEMYQMASPVKPSPYQALPQTQQMAQQPQQMAQQCYTYDPAQASVNTASPAAMMAYAPEQLQQQQLAQSHVPGAPALTPQQRAHRKESEKRKAQRSLLQGIVRNGRKCTRNDVIAAVTALLKKDGSFDDGGIALRILAAWKLRMKESRNSARQTEKSRLYKVQLALCNSETLALEMTFKFIITEQKFDTALLIHEEYAICCVQWDSGKDHELRCMPKPSHAKPLTHSINTNKELEQRIRRETPRRDTANHSRMDGQPTCAGNCDKGRERRKRTSSLCIRHCDHEHTCGDLICREFENRPRVAGKHC